MATPGVTGVIFLRHTSTDEQASVFATGDGDDVAVTLAMALDENPALIGLFLKALGMVRNTGNSRDDPAFAPVIFASEAAKH